MSITASLKSGEKYSVTINGSPSTFTVKADESAVLVVDSGSKFAVIDSIMVLPITYIHDDSIPIIEKAPKEHWRRGRPLKHK